MSVISLLYLPVWIVLSVFVFRRMLRYVHILQQDDYDNQRFLAWIWAEKAFDRRVSFCLVAFMIVFDLIRGLDQGVMFFVVEFIVFTVFLVQALREPNPCRVAKKKLVVTARVKRIVVLAFIVALAGISITAVMSHNVDAIFIGLLAIVQLSPLFLVVANGLLRPVEAFIQRGFWREAAARLATVHPIAIGVTGSFGKTSVKHILGHVLELNAPTYYTPGSVNTPMGIARMIREKMPGNCRYFLAEMGAYGLGSIARLCQLVPPRYGVITAVGDAHYERFKTIDTVAKAKFELAEAVLRTPEGRMVVHTDALTTPYAQKFVMTNRDRFLVVGSQVFGDIHPDVQIITVQQKKEGLCVALIWSGETHNLAVPLYGEHHAGNVALAFVMAVILGVAPHRAAAALRTTPQIKHRLEVKPQPQGFTIIDDAYNANPRGFSSALQLMASVAEGDGRRIVVTPGLIELGDRHESVHEELGKEAARFADILWIVRADRIPSFAQGFLSAGGKEVYEAPDFTTVQQWLDGHVRAGDVVLYENDLPDILEKRMVL